MTTETEAQEGRPAPATSVPGVAPPKGIRTGLRFALLFAACLLVGNLVLATKRVEIGVIEPWTRINAASAAAVTRLLGFPAMAAGAHLSSSGAELNVKNGCDGMHALLVLASAIVAFPASVPRKLLGLILGAVVVFGINIVRLVNLLLVAVYFPARLEFFHVYVWQVLIGLLAFGVFLLWGIFIARRR